VVQRFAVKWAESFSSKGAPADMTEKWPYSGMRSLVSDEIRCI